MFDDTHPSLVAGICGAVISFVLFKVFGVIDAYCKRQQDVKSLEVLYGRSRPVLQRMGNDDSGILWTKALDDANSIRVPWYNVFNILKLHKIMKDPTSDIYTTIAAAQLVVAAERVQALAPAPGLGLAHAHAPALALGLALAPAPAPARGLALAPARAPGSSSGSGQPAQAIDAARGWRRDAIRLAFAQAQVRPVRPSASVASVASCFEGFEGDAGVAFQYGLAPALAPAPAPGSSSGSSQPAQAIDAARGRHRGWRRDAIRLAFAQAQVRSVRPSASVASCFGFEGDAGVAFERGKEAVFESNEEIEIAAGDCEDEEADDFTEAEAAAAAPLDLLLPPTPAKPSVTSPSPSPPPPPSPKKDENGLYLRQKGKQKVGESIELDVALDDKEGKDKTL